MSIHLLNTIKRFMLFKLMTTANQIKARFMSYACAISLVEAFKSDLWGVSGACSHSLDMKVLFVLLAVVVCALSDEPNVYFKETFEDGGKFGF